MRVESDIFKDSQGEAGRPSRKAVCFYRVSLQGLSAATRQNMQGLRQERAGQTKQKLTLGSRSRAGHEVQRRGSRCASSQKARISDHKYRHLRMESFSLQKEKDSR